jgi:hypothetical protein
MRGPINCALHQKLLGDQSKEDEVGGTCSMNGRDEKYIQNFSWNTSSEETTWRTWEDNIRLNFKEMKMEYVKWIHLA